MVLLFLNGDPHFHGNLSIDLFKKFLYFQEVCLILQKTVVALYLTFLLSSRRTNPTGDSCICSYFGSSNSLSDYLRRLDLTTTVQDDSRDK